MKVVLGVGGTDDSLLALRQTVARTAVTGDSLTVAILDNPASERSPAVVEELVAEAVTDSDVDADIVRLEGDAGPVLAEFAESGAYDRIVLGGGTRSPMGKIALGDIAEFVLLNADTSVTLIR